MKIGAKLKQERLKKNLTQENVANILNVSRQTISNWEVGRNYPDLESLVALSDLYNFSLDKLLREDSEMVKKISKDLKLGKNISKMLISIIIVCILVVGFSSYKMHEFNKKQTEIYNLVDKKINDLVTYVEDEKSDVFKKELPKFLEKKELNTVTLLNVFIGESNDLGNLKLNYSYKNLYVNKNIEFSQITNEKIKDKSTVYYELYIDSENYDIYNNVFLIFISIGIVSLISIIVNLILSKLKKDNL